VRVLIGVAIVLTLAAVVGICGLFGWVGSAGRMRSLQAENDSLRVQFRRLGELEANLARMSELNEQMQKMLGVDPSTVGQGVDSLRKAN
jgi:Tfp pilus assembly protein PilO